VSQQNDSLSTPYGQSLILFITALPSHPTGVIPAKAGISPAKI
jgi:hypothetical protein